MRNTLQQFYRDTAGDEVEKAIVLDPATEREIFSVLGGKECVSIPESLCLLLEGKALVHNHPVRLNFPNYPSYWLSPEDFVMGAWHRLSSVTCVDPTGQGMTCFFMPGLPSERVAVFIMHLKELLREGALSPDVYWASLETCPYMNLVTFNLNRE